MIFLIKLFTILNCIDCKKYQQVIQDYINKYSIELQIIDVDNIDNLNLVLDSKIQSIPYAVFYNIHGSVMFSIEGVHSEEEFDTIIYENRN